MKKNYLLYFLLLALSTPIWVSCNDWTESEAKDYFEGPSEEYYAALRAYKTVSYTHLTLPTIA